MERSRPAPRSRLAPVLSGRAVIAVAALICVASVALPMLGAAADPEMTLTGRVAIDIGDGRGRPPVEHTMLETATQRLALTAIGGRLLRPGTIIRVRGHVRGATFELSRDGAAVTVATGMTADRAAATIDGGDLAPGDAPTSNRRVAVLLINFVAPSPTPPPTTTPQPTPTRSPTPHPSPTTEASPDPTDEPTLDPRSNAPSEADTPTPDPDPLATPSPEPMPTQESSPIPTAEPSPSAEPTPSGEPTPTPTRPPPGPPEPWTIDTVRGLYFTNTRSVAAYYNELSNGTMRMSGDVFGYFTIAANTNTCDYSTWGTAARKAAVTAGIDLTQYTNVVHAFPKQASCWWDGMANVPGRNTWINGAMTLYVAAHEIGHNLGLDHASSLTCKSGTVRVSFSSKCTVDEYGDPFDVMGANGSRLMHNWHRYQLGLLGADDVQTVTTSGSYLLSPAAAAGQHPRAIRVQRPDGAFYYVESRQPYGLFDNFSTTAPPVTGVTIRVAPDLEVVRSRLIDTNPQTATFSDSPLQVGRTFFDPVNTIYLTLVAVRADGAVVAVEFGPDVTPPGAITDLTATAAAGGSVYLAWSPVVDDVFVYGYEIRRDGNLIATTAETSFVDTGLTEGTTYSYSVVARDRSNSSAPTAVAVYLPDSTAPAPPAWLVARLEAPTTVALSWPASTDKVGVTGYSVWRDGEQLATTAALAYRDEAAPGGDGKYSVRAVDAAGNSSDAVSAVVDAKDVTPPTLSGALVLTSDGASVGLSWPSGVDAFGIDGYSIERNGTWLADVSSSSWVDRSVAPTNEYAYSVVAVDPSGNRSEPVTNSIVVADVTPPSEPTSVTAQLALDQTAVVRWGPSADDVGVDHYEVFRDAVLVASTDDLELGSVVAEQGHVHRFDVRAVDAAGNVSEPGSAELAVPDITPPQPVPSFSATASGETAVSLSWTGATDNVGVAGYRLVRDGATITTVSSVARSFVDVGRQSDRLYTYQIEAVDAAANVSTAVSATVALVSVDRTAPSVPTGLQAKSMGSRRVSLTWNASTDNRPGTIRYRVFRDGNRIATVTTRSFVDRPAQVGWYRYKVRAVDVAGNVSALSVAVAAKAVR